MIDASNGVGTDLGTGVLEILEELGDEHVQGLVHRVRVQHFRVILAHFLQGSERALDRGLVGRVEGLAQTGKQVGPLREIP